MGAGPLLRGRIPGSPYLGWTAQVSGPQRGCDWDRAGAQSGVLRGTRDASAGASPASPQVSCVFSPPPPAISPSRAGSEPNLLVRACNQLGQFLQHRETNLRYLALESMCTLASSEFSHEAVKTHIETVINALKASALSRVSGWVGATRGFRGPTCSAPGRSARVRGSLGGSALCPERLCPRAAPRGLARGQTCNKS